MEANPGANSVTPLLIDTQQADPVGVSWTNRSSPVTVWSWSAMTKASGRRTRSLDPRP